MSVDGERMWHMVETDEDNQLEEVVFKGNGTATLESSSCKDRILYTQDSEQVSILFFNEFIEILGAHHLYF